MEKVKVIWDSLMISQSHQKSYVDVRRRELKFEVDYLVFLKVSSMKGVKRFGRNGKLCTYYGGPYCILRRIGSVAYELEFPASFGSIHSVFYDSILKKCVGDPSLVVPNESVCILDSLSYDEVPIEILDKQVRHLRTKDVASVKVLRGNHKVEEAT